MDLLKIYEDVKKQKEKEEKTVKEIEVEKELRKLIASIIRGEEHFFTNSKKLCEDLKVKYDNRDTFTDFGSLGFGLYHYRFKLNKTNITKIQKYIEEKEVEIL
jgi:hypothetical protein